MSGNCLEKLPHSCGTETGLQVFDKGDGTVDGYCFACDSYIRHPYGEKRDSSTFPKPKKKTPEEIAEEMAVISNCATFDIPSRKLRAADFDDFNVKIGVSELDGKTPVSVHFPYTKDGEVVAYKNRLIKNKSKMWSVGALKGVDLFGWENAINSGAKTLLITEGEFDAVALQKILKRQTPAKYQGHIPAVVSLIHGAGSAKKTLVSARDKIYKHFKDVVLVFDTDKAGQQAVEEVVKVLPDVSVATLPRKDANQCLIDGVQQACYTSVTFKSQKQKNTRIILGDDLFLKAAEPAKWGELTWPWEHINQVTRGIRYGETIYIGGGVKVGKSEIVNTLTAHFIKNHGVKVFLAKPEESNIKSIKLLAGKLVGHFFHDPKVEFNQEKFDKATEIMRGKVMLLNSYQHVGWETLKADIISAATNGAKAIFIDPITNLTNGMDSGDANTKLQEIAEDLAAMAKDHNIVIFIFCHLKAHDGNIGKEVRKREYKKGNFIGLGNCPHEWGGDIFSAQFAGSRAMMRSCNYMIGIEGNKDPELEHEVRNIRRLKLLEDREFGESGTFRLYWDSETSLFKELEH